MLKSILFAAFLLPASWLPAQDNRQAGPVSGQPSSALESLEALVPANAEPPFSGHAIGLELGLNILTGDEPFPSSIGMHYGLSWNKAINAKRSLRFQLGIAFADYFPIEELSIGSSSFFKSTRLHANLHFDLVRVGAFAIVTGAGVSLNHVRGLTQPSAQANQTNWRPVQKIEHSGELYFGFRYNDPGQPISWNFSPFNATYGFNGFRIFRSTLSVDIKLRSPNSAL